jgi:asparagine synthase (glutamine-hydrolysing)
MSSLVGIVTDRPAEQAVADLSTMLSVLLHEPFYGHRTLYVPSVGCYLGWVSTDGRFRDCQFAVDDHDDVVAVFAGEHFGREAWHVRDLVDAYQREGEHCLRDLNGWFAGVIVDRRRERVVLFNDRYGLERICVNRSDAGFAFSSEAKSLITLRGGARLNEQAVGELLAIGSPLEGRTLFEDVFVLPPASAWSIDRRGGVARSQYFVPAEWERQSALTERQFGEALSATFSEVIPRYFRGPDPVAVSLTGGMDTRAVMAFRPPSGSALAYTYGGMLRDAFDVRISQRLAAESRYSHQVLRIGRDFLDQFDDLAEQTLWTTEGTADVCVTHEIYLSRQARAVAPVRLTGNFGSEILRSVSTFKPLGLPRELFASQLLHGIEEATSALTRLQAAHPISFAAFGEIPLNLYGRLAAAQTQLTVRSPFTDNAIVALAYRGPASRVEQTRIWQQVIAERSPALASIPTDTGRVGVQQSAWRLPDRLYKYCLFKAEWYYDGGMPAWLSRVDATIGKRRTPWFAGTHKMEHYRRWFRDELSTWVESTVRPAADLPYFNPVTLDRVLKAHATGAANFSNVINRVATVALLHRLFVDPHRRVADVDKVKASVATAMPLIEAGAPAVIGQLG